MTLPLEEHVGTVYRYALRLTGRIDAAEDLTQETMLRAWRRREQLRDELRARGREIIYFQDGIQGAIETPLGHYTVMGTTTYVAAPAVSADPAMIGERAEGSEMDVSPELEQRLSAFVVYLQRAREFPAKAGQREEAKTGASGDPLDVEGRRQAK